MVSSAIHYVTGLVISRFFKVNDNKKYLTGLWAVAPDLDILLFLFPLILSRIFSIGNGNSFGSQISVVLFSHRGISHSLLLLAVVISLLWIFKSKNILMIAILWGSHLFWDVFTSWKIYLFLPFSYVSSSLNLVEVFDSILTFLFTIIFALFIGKSLLSRRKKLPLVIAYIFFTIFGTASSVAMGEYNIQTIILSQVLFFFIVLVYWSSSKLSETVKKDHAKKGFQAIVILFILAGVYMAVLAGAKATYMPFARASFSDLEPLEEFAFNMNAHTFEVDEGENWRIGLISLNGIEEEKTIPKVVNDVGIEQSVIDSFLTAYPYAIGVNWINKPVWIFLKDEDGQPYANVKYAKSFLENPNMPGPHHGMNVKMEEDKLVRYGQRNDWN